MSAWRDIEEWEKYCSAEGCPICQGVPNDLGTDERTLAELRISTLVTDRRTCMKGHCCLVLKPHAVELFDLDDDEALAFAQDIKLAARVLKHVTGAVKINYEIHGNTIPHLHMHLWPRQIGDRFENAPIDWRLKDRNIYAEGEYEAFVETMRDALRR